MPSAHPTLDGESPRQHNFKTSTLRRNIMGSGIGNFINVALSAVGAAFGGPLGAMVAQMAKQLIGSVLDSLIDQLPIPNEFKNLLQSAVHAGLGDVPGAIKNAQEFIGDLGQSMGGSATDVASMQNDLSSFTQDAGQMLTQLINSTAIEREGPDGGGGSAKPGNARGGRGAAGGGAAGGASSAGGAPAAGGARPSSGSGAGQAAGWLRAMAEALGKTLDDLAHEMEAAAEAIDKEDPSTSVKFQVISQQFGIVMNAASTAIKSVGEAMSSMARKQ
jgi:hypothetical protein